MPLGTRRACRSTATLTASVAVFMAASGTMDCVSVKVVGMAGEGSGPASVSVQMGQGAGGQLAGLLAALVHHDNVL